MKLALQKVRITGFKTHYKILMQELHKSGVLEVKENADFISKSSTSQADEHFGVFDLARLQFVIDFLAPYASKTSKLDSMLSGGKLVLPESEAKKRFQGFESKADKIIAECEQLEADLVKAQNELQQIPQQKELISVMANFKGSIAEDYKTDKTESWIGKIPLSGKKSFLEVVAAKSNLIDTAVLGENKTHLFIRVSAWEELAEFVGQKLQEYQYEPVDLASEFHQYVGSSVSEIEKTLAQKEKSLAEEIEKIETKIASLTTHIDNFKILFEYSQWRKTKNDLQQKMFQSEEVFAFEAWLIGSCYDDLARWIKNSFVGGVVIEKIKPGKNEEMPVLMKNKWGLNSFEPITEMYGLPQLKEFDPTPFLAPFFLIFFGLCLSDVGYGMILAVISGFFLLFGKFSAGAKSTLRLLLYCGMAAIVGGVLLGGYFGMTPAQMPFLADGDSGKFYGQMLTPTEGSGPITFLVISLVLGVIHLLVGMLLAFFQQIKNKDYDGAFFDTATWIFALGSIGVFGLADLIGVDKDMARNGALVGAAALVLTQGRHQKNWLLKPVFGLLGLYNITNYLSDLLSYSRIMALGLATGVVGFAMNLTAGIFSEMMPHPVLGIAVAVFVVVFGHFLNFSLSLLGAFIHSGRLQFIEFFGKFYEGGGQKFQPFIRQSKYLFFRGE